MNKKGGSETGEKMLDYAAHCNGWIRQHTQSPASTTMAGVSEGPKWWERTEEPDTVWRACVTDDGLDYYVNTETNETSHVQHAAYQHGTRLAVDGPRATWILLLLPHFLFC